MLLLWWEADDEKPIDNSAFNQCILFKLTFAAILACLSIKALCSRVLASSLVSRAALTARTTVRSASDMQRGLFAPLFLVRESTSALSARRSVAIQMAHGADERIGELPGCWIVWVSLCLWISGGSFFTFALTHLADRRVRTLMRLCA